MADDPRPGSIPAAVEERAARDAFESVMRLRRLDRAPNGEYRNTFLQEEWEVWLEAWQARAALAAPTADVMADRLMTWRLPPDFHPDGYISFDAARAANDAASWPVGTNLLTHVQAKAMFEYVLGGEHAAAPQPAAAEPAKCKACGDTGLVRVWQKDESDQSGQSDYTAEDECPECMLSAKPMAVEQPAASTVPVAICVTDALAHKLTGSDAAELESSGNVRDAQIIRERAQAMWDALLASAGAPAAASTVPATSNLVPGQMRCARCKFQLTRAVLYMGSGTVGAGDSKTEPCPNGCGPLWPVTWEEAARDTWAACEQMFERAKAAEDKLAAISGPRLVDSDAAPAAVEREAGHIDTQRLDYLQSSGATVEFLPGAESAYPMRFRVGGLHKAVHENIRCAIDSAIELRGIGSSKEGGDGR